MMDTETPEALKPYVFHGVELSWKRSGKNASGTCPSCGREGKFEVEVETGRYHCFVCDVKGNVWSFLRWLWTASDRATTAADYGALAADRRVNPDTLMAFGVARSILSPRDWIVPAYNEKGKLAQLYRYVEKGGKKRLLATPTLRHQLFGSVSLAESETVYVCEGPWDAMSLWEALRGAKETEGELVPTANPDSSLLNGASVLAVPGCMVFSEKWLPLFEGKRVVLLYDNDHPRKDAKTGREVAPAGHQGLQRAIGLLAASPKKPERIEYLEWGPDGYDLTLPSGYDVRDFLAPDPGEGEESETSPVEALGRPVERLEALLGRLVVVEAGSVRSDPRASSGSSRVSTSTELGPSPCDNYRQLTTAWRKALRWTGGLDHALAVMLAAVASTKTIGDQLWVKVIGPAACGKSTLCEAVSVNREYVVAKSTIRGFHSGFRESGDGGGEDSSLIRLLYDKTLVTKDGDTLLQSPNLPQILSEARDLYDGTSRTHYRNRVANDHSGVRVTWILCGTSSLRAIDSSELGERFLDCVIMEGIDGDLEDEILWRVVNRAERNLSIESDGKPESHYEPELAEAMRLTGGYVGWLRESAAEELSKIESPEKAKWRCTRLGKFVAYMRARPSKKQEESSEREFAARLVSQLIRLAKCLALVLNREEIDEEVMKRVTRVALDTSRGQTLAIVAHLYDAERRGLSLDTISHQAGRSIDKTRPMVSFLQAIGVIECFKAKAADGRNTRVTKYRLTDNLQRLYTEVLGLGETHA